MTAKQRYRRRARGQYQRHKERARARGVPFRLTFKQWCAVWFFSGYWKVRGSWAGAYVMGRKGDEGAYELGNVTIIPWTRNSIDGMRKARRVRRKHTKRSTLVWFEENPSPTVQG